MDLLSRLLALMPVAGRVDVRCQFGAPWRIHNPGTGAREMPYHVLLRGEATLDGPHGEPVRMRAGDIVLFPAGAPHALHDGSGAAPRAPSRERVDGIMLEHNGGDDVDLLCGRFLLPAMPERLLRESLPAQLLVHSVPEPAGAQADESPPTPASGAGSGLATSRLARLIALMREEALEQGPASTTLIDHLSGALFALTLRFASAADTPPRGLLALAARPRLQPALAAMFDAPGEAWTLPALAQLCHMSRATFVRQFDDAFGRSAADVLTDLRMALAGRKLAQTSLPVAEIGEAVGYQSEAAFQRVFKRQVGMTPAQWRAAAQAGSAPLADSRA
jgi:AraC family transcriptional activator of mtrCDE